MPVPVPLKILSRREQRNRLIVVLVASLAIGAGSRALRPLFRSGIHWETLIAVILLAIACLLLVLGMRQIAWWRGMLVYLIECTAVWVCFAIGWLAVAGHVRGDLLGVSAMFWASCAVGGLIVLWVLQHYRPPSLDMRCAGCGYALAGLTHSRCPECGTVFIARCAGCGCALQEFTNPKCPDCDAVLATGGVIVRKVGG